MKQSTSYPVDGHVDIEITPQSAVEFALKVRIPGWVCHNRPLASDLYRYANSRKNPYVVRVHGEVVDVQLDRGYATVQRNWRPGDTV